MKCYICEKEVKEQEHKLVKDLEDWLEDADGYKEVFEAYADNFVHCQGPSEQFDADGIVVVCAECFGKFLRQAVWR